MRTSLIEREDDAPSGEPPFPDTDTLRQDVHLGLQICRANSLSLTRLQLALQNGDRRCVLEAIDRLHDLDSQIGRLLKRLPISANDDPEVQAICKHIDEQSMAVAFEKLVLASEVSGPDMVTPRQTWSGSLQSDASSEIAPEQPGGLIVTRSIPYQKVLSFVLALLAFTALAFAITFALVG